MKYFISTKYVEDNNKIDLISISIVSEYNREYYAINEDYNLKENYSENKDLYLSKSQIKEEIITFIGDDDKPEFWGYCSGYDWVVFCQIFGELPKNFPMYCKDLKQLIDSKGSIKISINRNIEHNALLDARWNKRVFEYIHEYY